MSKYYDYVIVGAGFAGAVIAERLSSEAGKTCLVVERRDHVGGNAFDYYNSDGVLLHAYGPHYFRTNSERIKNYLSQFTDWHPVDYRVLSWTEGRYWQFPINLNTFEQLLGRPSNSDEMEMTLAKWRVEIKDPKNSEEAIISQVGPVIFEKFFKHYTRKQWGREAKDLDPSVCRRIPIRTNRDDRYFSDSFQALPKKGYTEMFKRMLKGPKIKVQLGTDYREVLPQVTCGHLIYTGPIDAYYDFCYGPLPYRSLRFVPETIQQEYFQPVMQVNYPNDHEFTRIVEIKHATGQQLPVTTIVREFPEDHKPGREPYYPVPAPDAQAIYDRYAKRAKMETKVSFVGRLATYRYYNMDQVVGMALTEYERVEGYRAGARIATTPEKSLVEEVGAVVSPVSSSPCRDGDRPHDGPVIPTNGEFLDQLVRMLNWQSLESALDGVASEANSGFSPPVLLKTAILQYCYRLSDGQCCGTLADRVSWRRFVGLSFQDTVPDESSLKNFKSRLMEKGRHILLLHLCEEQLKQKGLELRRGGVAEPDLARSKPSPLVGKGEAQSGALSPVSGRLKRAGKRSQLYFFAPYSMNGNLGWAYNSYMKLVPRDDDWVCFVDRDVMFMTPDYGSQIAEIVAQHPDTGLLTALTNRIGNRSQLHGGEISDDPNIVNHRDIAADLQRRCRYEVQRIEAPVSGFLMVVRKRVWKAVKFSENLKLLHADWDFSRRLVAKGYSIGLMKGVYVFHYYRLKEGAADISHLVKETGLRLSGRNFAF
jgi:UDP-galactopyranose mutase